MARYVAMQCLSKNCEQFEKIWSHVQIGLGESGDRIFACEACANVRQYGPAPAVPKKKTTWPYYHEGCGVRFESESHEQKYTKAHGMTKE